MERLTRRKFLRQTEAFLVGAFLPLPGEGSPKKEKDLVFYFRETGHHLEGPFLDFWRTKGGRFVFGDPISEVLEEFGMPVQYFQKARLEFHPDGQVRLGLLGSELFEKQGFTPLKKWTSGPKFSLFYKKRGGLEIFGYPLSEVLEEEGRWVQYFQRAKFEYHPETVDPFYSAQEKNYGLTLLSLGEVQLTNLGEIMVAKKGFPVAPRVSKEGAIDYSSFSPFQKIVIDLKKQELTAFEGKTSVLRTSVSTGLVVPGVLQGTPTGSFEVLHKDKELTYRGWNPLLGRRYEYFRVPFNLHFYPPDAPLYFIHGVYWHNAFGKPRSQGCVNLDLDFAEQLYHWSEVGTLVEIF